MITDQIKAAEIIEAVINWANTIDELSRDEVIVLCALKQLKGGHYRDEAYARQARGEHYGQPSPT